MSVEGIYAFADQIKVYKAILDSTQEIQEWLRYHSGKYTLSYYNTVVLCNPFLTNSIILCSQEAYEEK